MACSVNVDDEGQCEEDTLEPLALDKARKTIGCQRWFADDLTVANPRWVRGIQLSPPPFQGHAGFFSLTFVSATRIALCETPKLAVYFRNFQNFGRNHGLLFVSSSPSQWTRA